MNTPFRRVLLAITIALGIYVGVWAQFFPEQFYRSFPGFGLHWIDLDGPFNEHLIRDVGSAYLGLSAASIVGVFHRSALPGRVAGVAWGSSGCFISAITHFIPKGPRSISPSVCSFSV
ncbi:hypothetical protein [Leifsonia poae]|uniref:hypothetical protein n=1 Tax=Leifsonia poae TaxID=110933 RepID=UPI003D677A72